MKARVLALFLVTVAAYATPQVSFDATGLTKLDEEATRDEKETARKRFAVDLFAPVLSSPLMVLPRLGYDRQMRTNASGVEDWHNLQLGTIFVAEKSYQRIQPFFLYTRFGDREFKNAPMNEWLAGLIVKDWLDLWFPDNAGRQNGKILYRYRKFPGRDNHIVLIDYDLRFSQWDFSVGVPSHFRVGWFTKDRSLYLYYESRAEARSYPLGKDHWIDGFDFKSVLGSRWPVFSIVHLDVSTGLNQENYSLYDGEGERVWSHKTKFAPFIQLALKTVVSKE